MKRPDFVTDEEISRWTEELENDELTPSPFKDEVLLREIIFSGMWLVEKLQDLDCPDHHIVQLQFAHGFESFGVDCWKKAEEILLAYENGEVDFSEADEDYIKLKDPSN